MAHRKTVKVTHSGVSQTVIGAFGARFTEKQTEAAN
jgi:hypothetical protein